ncbi:aspartic peptidase domain-containing protein [Kockovaella imperatae]|uniref:Aspartic peptidase domain-containing protein n=1 Tax=Kockovaella imperatae TaxID=4999 RepID=A0A1Y1UMJ3_9TREE|nr:aspartic peptidase domain-containing protein [Kockovaella imperatae]ORX38737.1 aspartic peptidase domain-containing protein [Kockovaella imperatae]
MNALLALAPLAVAAATSVGPVPFSDHVLPITSKVPRSNAKTQSLKDYMYWASSCFYPPGEGNGTQVSLDAPYGGSQYTVNVTIAGEDYNLILDTGSSDLWLPASNFSCLLAANPMILANYTKEPQSVCEFGSNLFNISDIGEFMPLNYTNNFNISYGVQGYSDLQFATGSSYIGAVGIGNLTVPNAQLNIVYNAEFFGNNVSDGLIGFAGPGLTSVFATANPMNDSAANYEPYLPWFYQAAEDGLVAPYFSLALNRPTFADQETSDVVYDLGYLVLGGLPKCIELTGKYVTVPNHDFNETVNGQNVTLPLWWTTTVDEWTFAGSDAINTTTELIILDSGTFNVYAPNAVAEAYANAFSPPGVYNASEGGYVVPCNATVPPLSVTIGGVEFPFDQRDLIFPLTANGEYCLSTVTNGGNTTSDVYILGDKFFNSAVIAFNVENDTMTIYERKCY